MIWILLSLLACLGGTGWLGWISFQSFRQGLLLGALPKGIVGALDGQTLTAHGKVKLIKSIDVAGAGPCLWCRITQKELDPVAWGLLSRRREWRTVSDQVSVADFDLVVNGEEIEIETLPTEVQGTRTSRTSDGTGFFDQFSETSYMQVLEWLPVLEELTVIGRLERRDNHRVLVADPQLGLLLSPHPSSQAAQIEWMKAVAGFVGVLGGTGVSLWLFLRLVTKM